MWYNLFMPSNDPNYQKEYIRKHYQANKQYYKDKAAQRKKDVLPKRRAIIARYKTFKGCIDCGYNLHPHALDFDHVFDTKEFDISPAVNNLTSWKRIRKEIRKCEVRCANCHRIKTFERRNSI